jgi:hypothetical protein
MNIKRNIIKIYFIYIIIATGFNKSIGNIRFFEEGLFNK